MTEFTWPPLAILHEDEQLIALAKPYGLATQAPAGIPSLESQLREYLAGLPDAAEDPPYIGTPHRLDRPTSGVVLFGKDRPTTRRLSRQFEQRRVEKTYWAVVEGLVDPVSGVWEDWVRKIPDHARGEVVPPDAAEAKLARLHYRQIAATDRLTWLECQLETGRYHQIRVQAAKRGHPVVGDCVYGATMPFGPAADDNRLRWIALHARSLALRRPGTGTPLRLEAPLPPAWSELPLG